MEISIKVNGEMVSRDVPPQTLLVHFIRDTPGLTGTHWGCDTSNCGVCIVQIDGQAVPAAKIEIVNSTPAAQQPAFDAFICASSFGLP